MEEFGMHFGWYFVGMKSREWFWGLDWCRSYALFRTRCEVREKSGNDDIRAFM